jgi:hypothetical protein
MLFDALQDFPVNPIVVNITELMAKQYLIKGQTTLSELYYSMFVISRMVVLQHMDHRNPSDHKLHRFSSLSISTVGQEQPVLLIPGLPVLL